MSSYDESFIGCLAVLIIKIILATVIAYGIVSHIRIDKEKESLKEEVLLLQAEKTQLLNTIEDLENREIVTVEFVEEKKVQKPIAIKLNNRYNMIEDERELFARLLYCEGGNESVECQRAIASVVLNRLHSGKWGDSLTSVIYATGQFQPVSSGAILTAKPSQTQYDVIDYVNENGCTIPSWVMFFRASYHFNWKNYTPYCQIDNTFFGGYNNE